MTRDRGAAGSSLTGVTALCPWARHINSSLVLVQPRKTRPYITERLLMGRKESNQTKTQKLRAEIVVCGIKDNRQFLSFSLLLCRTHMQDLIDVTNNVHYENYRYNKLAPATTDGKVKPGALAK